MDNLEIEVQIRRADSHDLQFVINSQIAMAFETEKIELDRNVVGKGVNAVLQDEHKGHYLIAEHDSSPVGVMLVVKEWSDWRNVSVLWIHSLYVLDEFRGKKVFKKLYEKLKSYVLEDDHFGGIRLYVDKTNEKAKAVYKSIGMSDEHYTLFEWLKK